MLRYKEIFLHCHKANVPILLKGVHGIGKSERIDQYAKENNMHCETLFLSTQETGDLIGIQKEHEEFKDIFYWSKPIWLFRMENAYKQNKKCVLFLDELNRARIDIRQAAIPLALTKKIHQHELPPDTLIIAAINPEENGDYQVQELDEALLDRFAIFEFFPDLEEWLLWAKNNNINESIINFLINNPKYLWSKKTELELAGPTPRGWVQLNNFIKTIDIKDSKQIELILLFATAKIGLVVGGEFYKFYLNNFQLTINDIEEICKNKTQDDLKETIKIIKKRIAKEEIQRINYIADELIEKYFNKNLTKKSTYNSVFPAIVFLHSLESELLHAALKKIKNNNIKVFDKINNIDISLSRKIIDLKLKFELQKELEEKKWNGK